MVLYLNKKESKHEEFRHIFKMKLEQELFFDCQLYIHTDQITRQCTIPAPLFHSKMVGEGAGSTLLLSLHMKGIKLVPDNSKTTVALSPELKML